MAHHRGGGGVIQGAGGAIVGLFVIGEILLLLIGVLFGILEMFLKWLLRPRS